MRRIIGLVAIVVAVSACGSSAAPTTGTGPTAGAPAATTAAGSPAAVGTAASPDASAATSPDGTANELTACPLTREKAAELAGEPMEVAPPAVGDGSFRGETVGDNTTYLCTLQAVASSSDYSLSMHLDYSDGDSATRRWDILGEPSADQGWEVMPVGAAGSPDTFPAAPVDPGTVWRRVMRDEPGKRDIVLTIHGPSHLVTVAVAAYGGTQSMDDVKAWKNEIGQIVLAALWN